MTGQLYYLTHTESCFFGDDVSLSGSQPSEVPAALPLY